MNRFGLMMHQNESILFTTVRVSPNPMSVSQGYKNLQNWFPTSQTTSTVCRGLGRAPLNLVLEPGPLVGENVDSRGVIHGTREHEREMRELSSGDQSDNNLFRKVFKRI